MNKIELQNRLEYLAKQIPEKKFLIEKTLKELQLICDEIKNLEQQIKENE